jgi:hypothetical protein
VAPPPHTPDGCSRQDSNPFKPAPGIQAGLPGYRQHPCLGILAFRVITEGESPVVFLG